MIHLEYVYANRSGYEAYQSLLSGFSDSDLEGRLENGLPTAVQANATHSHDLLCVYAAQCNRCGEVSIWIKDKQMYPFDSSAPLPNADMPDILRTDYEEARAILNRSPRGAAALLRLATQKLCKHLGESGKNLNTDIKKLAAKGLNQSIVDALDALRVIGNNAVHPGEMDLSDDTDTALALFELINLIVEKMISDPKKIQAIHSSIPAKDKANIQKRDASKRNSP